jgi:hypothetical protein
MTLNRRNFLRNLGITGSLLAVPSAVLQATPLFRKGNIDLSTITLKGKVHSSGKGIPGVSVTDGINIVQTDKNGDYQLQSNGTAEFVYISVPAGYAFPEEKGIATFFRPLTKASGVIKN